jgi:3-phytase
MALATMLAAFLTVSTHHLSALAALRADDQGSGSATSSSDSRTERSSDPRGAGSTVTVPASAETATFPGASGDVADDMAIWRDPDNPERSLIVAANKADDGGVAVHRLDGSLAHYERMGSIGNIDLRTVGVNGQSVVLVGANDRSDNTLRLWTLDPRQSTLTRAEARSLPTVTGNYGFCLGHDASYAHTYAFITSESGVLEQYELWVNSGRIDAAKLRSFDVGGIVESCAVDDRTGSLYVGEESAGVWRYDVDPASGDRRTSIDKVGQGRLTADVEGISAVRGPDGQGVLIVSSQGDSTFAMYGLDGDHSPVGRFRVSGGNGADDVTDTDGLEAVPGDFGPSFPNGLLVVHDGSNEKPGGGEEPSSNLKLVRLDQVVKLSSS